MAKFLLIHGSLKTKSGKVFADKKDPDSAVEIDVSWADGEALIKAGVAKLLKAPKPMPPEHKPAHVDHKGGK